jgi:hypothetical protein
LTTALERRSLLQRLRLKAATERHTARLTMSFATEDLALLPGLPRKTLEAWAGARLVGLVDEIGRAHRPAAESTQVAISRPIESPEEGAALCQRADIFAHLVRFALAEQRLIAARGIGAGSV